MNKGLEEVERQEKYVWKIISLFASRRDFDKMDHKGQQKFIEELRKLLKEYRDG